MGRKWNPAEIPDLEYLGQDSYGQDIEALTYPDEHVTTRPMNRDDETE